MKKKQNTQVKKKDMQSAQYQNYWDTAESYSDDFAEKVEEEGEIRPRAAGVKRVTFTDILSNMNLVVNKHGVLQSIQLKTHAPAPLAHPDHYGDHRSHRSAGPVPHRAGHAPVAGIDPALKQSFLYNKYFKDYHALNEWDDAATPQAPMTREEYVQHLREREEARRRIEQVKSRKLMFTTSSPGILPPNTIQASTPRNTLRSMTFS